MNDFSNFVPLTAQGVVVMYLLNDFFVYVYLRAACLPLNVVENQTTVGRLCRLELENATEHSWRTSVNSATKEIRHSRISAVATHNNFMRRMRYS